MTLNGAIMQLVQMRESEYMPTMFKPLFDKVIETVSECEEPGAPTVPHWIPVTERLPEKFSYCIVSGGRSVWFARFEDGEFLGILSGHALDSVIAWQPLPAPYKEDHT